MLGALGIRHGLALAFAVSFSVTAHGDSVTTRVDARTDVSSLWRNSHPAKLFECWGKPDEARTWTDSEQTGSSANSGSVGAVHRPTGKAGFRPYSPQTLTWKSELSPERDFSIEFRQDVTESQTSYIHHKCSTQRFVSRLDRLENRLRSNARLTVPPGVWLLRVRKSVETFNARTKHDLKISITGADPVAEDSGASPLAGKPLPLKLAVGDAEYLMVEPGSNVDFSVDWSTREPHGLDFRAKFEIRMIGVDECRRRLGTPEEFGRSANPDTLARLFSIENSLDDPHGAIERISCLRNEDYLAALMYRGHGASLVRLYDGLNRGFLEWQRRRNATPLFDALKLSTEIALLDSSRALMKDMLVYCSVDEVGDLFGAAPDRPVRLRGYQTMARAMARVKYLLDVAPLDLTAEYVALVEKLAAEGKTYREAAASPDSRRLLRELHDTLMDDEFMVFEPVHRLLTGLRPVVSGRAERLTAETAAAAALTASREFQEELRTSFARFGAGSAAPIGTAALRARFDRLRALHADVVRGLARDVEWFLGATGDVDYPPFTRDLLILNHDLLRVASENLKIGHASKLSGRFAEKFLRLTETDRLYERALSCMRSSDGN